MRLTVIAPTAAILLVVGITAAPFIPKLSSTETLYERLARPMTRATERLDPQFIDEGVQQYVDCLMQNATNMILSAEPPPFSAIKAHSIGVCELVGAKLAYARGEDIVEDTKKHVFDQLEKAVLRGKL